jgi:hypothetical protein
LKLVNYGGHGIEEGSPLAFEVGCQYKWHGLARKPLIPTLTAALLLSFALASIARYRPEIARAVEETSLNVLLDTFVTEADAIVIPSMRNLLFREEMCVKSEVAI